MVCNTLEGQHLQEEQKKEDSVSSLKVHLCFKTQKQSAFINGQKFLVVQYTDDSLTPELIGKSSVIKHLYLYWSI